jgi:hypothetical protein
MANITVKNLEVYPTNLAVSFSEQQIDLYGGICAASYDGMSQGCIDVIINFPEKLEFAKIPPKRK